MKTYKARVLAVALVLTMCLTSCTAQNVVITHPKAADSGMSAASSVPQSESVGTSSAVMDDSRSESVAFSLTSASESTGSQSKTTEEPFSWADKACAPVTFAEDPAGCVSYALWAQLEKLLMDIENREIPQDSKQKKIQRNLEEIDPYFIMSAALADLNQDGVPELFLSSLCGWLIGISVYDLSGQEPILFARIDAGGENFSLDYVYNETGNVVARISSCYGHAMYNYDYLTFMEKQVDGNWNVWWCEQETEETADNVSRITRKVFHGLEEVEDTDDSLYNQLKNRSVAPLQITYVEMYPDEMYKEFSGDNWWIAYGKSLWEEYQKALQQTNAAG